MNIPKMYKSFNAKNLESTIAGLVSIHHTEIIVRYHAFDESCHIINSENYVINMASYHKYLGQKSPSVKKAVDKILVAHPSAYLQAVEFDTYTGQVIVTFYEI